METTYTPYSVMNNIKNKKIAELVDYIERDIGWDEINLDMESEFPFIRGLGL